MTDSIAEILHGLRGYFDKALPLMLLYKKEKPQYHEAVTNNMSPSTVYGAEHLLRLFGMLIHQCIALGIRVRFGPNKISFTQLPDPKP